MKILIIDPRPFVRSGLQVLLSGSTDFQIYGEVTSKKQAIQFVKESPPDLLIPDWWFGRWENGPVSP